MKNENEKKAIIEALEAYVVANGSQNKAANRIGISSGTITQLRRGEWAQISDAMWAKVESAVCGGKTEEAKGWKIVDTATFADLMWLFTDAQEGALVMAACGEAGSGKSVTARHYADTHEEAYVIQCNDYWTRKDFLGEILRAMGNKVESTSIHEMVTTIVDNLKSNESPLLIIDEADKLSDRILYFFITLYNSLENHCGIVILATDYLKKKITAGVRLNRKGYNEIYSRIGRKFVALKGVEAADIVEVCKANGCDDGKEIKSIITDAGEDMRRVRRRVFAYNKKKVA